MMSRIIFVFIFLSMISTSQAVVENQTFFCSNSQGLPCNSTTICETTIHAENFTTIKSGEPMTFIKDGFYNYTIDEPKGIYFSSITCVENGGTTKSTEASFEIGDGSMFDVAIMIGLAALTFSLLYTATQFRDNKSVPLLILFLISGLFSAYVMIDTMVKVADINNETSLAEGLTGLYNFVWLPYIVIIYFLLILYIFNIPALALATMQKKIKAGESKDGP